jgi:hypothetical protein
MSRIAFSHFFRRNTRNIELGTAYNPTTPYAKALRRHLSPDNPSHRTNFVSSSVRPLQVSTLFHFQANSTPLPQSHAPFDSDPFFPAHPATKLHYILLPQILTKNIKCWVHNILHRWRELWSPLSLLLALQVYDRCSNIINIQLKKQKVKRKDKQVETQFGFCSGFYGLQQCQPLSHHFSWSTYLIFILIYFYFYVYFIYRVKTHIR